MPMRSRFLARLRADGIFNCYVKSKKSKNEGKILSRLLFFVVSRGVEAPPLTVFAYAFLCIADRGASGRRPLQNMADQRGESKNNKGEAFRLPF